MKPYYADDHVAIYHGDCREILPTLDEDVALVLTDPPYGIGYIPKDRLGRKSAHDGVRIYGDDASFDPRHLLGYGRCIIWGANYFAHLLPPGGWIVWSKAQDNRWANGRASCRSLAEVAWTNLHNYVGLYNCFWAGSPLYRQSERGVVLHPTQKPVELMRWLVGRYTQPGDLVLDPYMGSGPVAQACRDLGRRYIGVEIEEVYCKAAVGRLAQATFDFGEAA